MDDIKHKFELLLIDALSDLAERAKKIDALIDNCVDMDILDDCTDEYYIEFDFSDDLICDPVTAGLNMKKWEEMTNAAPKIFYSAPSKSRTDDTCYYLDYGDGMRHWCYMEDCMGLLETYSSNFNELMNCRRFMFNAILYCVKDPDS